MNTRIKNKTIESYNKINSNSTTYVNLNSPLKH